MYPSEYAYHGDFVYRYESDCANCRNYQQSLDRTVNSEDYIHCDGTPLRLTDSDIGSQQFTITDYYVWFGGETPNQQLLFIFPTRIMDLTNITLHYYGTSDRGLPRLRFWAVPDDFDVWNALTSGYSYVDVAAVPPGEEPASHRNVSVRFTELVNSHKILMYKFASTFSFTVSEVEFFSWSSCR